ncbi:MULTISPECIES: LysR substrate-binding domain-containing protein [unclassified Undibacterium]|uniref:LysR substrate-binding domain-containing protein n=1 Tax=unclassified Undibacterium TaxID=2630295 RepID=UPI002AC9E8A1|nr:MULTISPECIES: LysR substrate-binding domain-containing protein [unclassified Undibacterium]MEB0138450.1 LysR substrate-binding domain-containing protein [Undibacterium sp. CCC2.1]MEB0171325.1 LysR substrate-binding domain-containing protein [Undibacterium sp. CCC1.1]MEB0176438.1 LysR substrate-binding domain-containing protein [Undibacterium sp. CCC3.4]MEB0214079.1 LysR substrate-binding domain-containing protein [Undibacterium sp. 5I2]WPX43690.1 LysR substrate-binding domain-containing pro
MDLKQLDYFVHVAELGSFTRAAAVLAIAQPALSRQIRQLEVELRQNLLTRNGRGVTTTEAGQLLLEHGRGILHQVARAKEDLGRIRGALAGRVSVGLPPSASKILTVPLTRAFRQHLPNATLSISEGLSTSMQEWLLTGRLDIALLYNPTQTSELALTPLAEERLYFVSPGHANDAAAPITLKDIAALPLVIPNRPNAIRMLIEAHMATIGCKPLIHLEIDSVAAILDLVADGAGHAILTEYAVTTSTQPEAYRMRPIIEPGLVTRLTMATAAGRITTLTQNAMMALIKDVAATMYTPL